MAQQESAPLTVTGAADALCRLGIPRDDAEEMIEEAVRKIYAPAPPEFPGISIRRVGTSSFRITGPR